MGEKDEERETETEVKDRLEIERQAGRESKGRLNLGKRDE